MHTARRNHSGSLPTATPLPSVCPWRWPAGPVPPKGTAGPLASSFADVSEYSEIVCLAPAAHEYLTEGSVGAPQRNTWRHSGTASEAARRASAGRRGHDVGSQRATAAPDRRHCRRGSALRAPPALPYGGGAGAACGRGTKEPKAVVVRSVAVRPFGPSDPRRRRPAGVLSGAQRALPRRRRGRDVYASEGTQVVTHACAGGARGGTRGGRT